MKEFLSSLFWPTLTGILAAAIILDQWVLPEPLGRDRSQIRTSYSDAVALATPSVVNIYTAKLVDSGRNQRLNDPLLRRFLGNSGRRQRVERSLGSGVILTAEGHIITNNHVIADADAIQVLLHDGRSATATAIGTDPATDLAVLQIQLPGLTPITLANSDDAQVGDVVLDVRVVAEEVFEHAANLGLARQRHRHSLDREGRVVGKKRQCCLHVLRINGVEIRARCLLEVCPIVHQTVQSASVTGKTCGLWPPSRL